MSVRVMLADDHRMFREALASQLRAEPGIEIVAETSTGAETLVCVGQALPQVLVLDIGLPDINGVEIALQVRELYPDIRVVALSGYADRFYVQKMLQSGASAYVVKSGGIAELLTAIHAVVAGHTFLSPAITDLLVQGNHDRSQALAPPVAVLTPREREILSLLASGRRSAQIGEDLGISTATVDVHRRNIREKLKLTTTAELTRYAIREGLHSA